MRTALKALMGQDIECVGVVGGFGRLAARRLILLTCVMDASETCLLADHVWITETKALRRVKPLQVGLALRFTARVKHYHRVSDETLDFGLSRLKGVRRR